MTQKQDFMLMNSSVHYPDPAINYRDEIHIQENPYSIREKTMLLTGMVSISEERD